MAELKQYRMTYQQLQNVYRYKAFNTLNLDVTIEQMEATDEVRDGENFCDYYDRHKESLDLYEETI